MLVKYQIKKKIGNPNQKANKSQNKFETKLDNPKWNIKSIGKCDIPDAMWCSALQCVLTNICSGL